MSETLDRLAEIRVRQGLPPIDGSRIMDDPAQAPPLVPTAEPTPDPEDWFAESPGEPQDAPGETIGPWPEPPVEEPPLRQEAAVDLAELLTQKELVVMDGAAMYRQRSVKLTEAEKSQVILVVLKAIRRSLDEQYAEVAGVKPRRVRSKKGSEPQPDAVLAPSSKPKKRRGRPPRQRLDGGSDVRGTR